MFFAVINSPLLGHRLGVTETLDYSKAVPDEFWELRPMVEFAEEKMQEDQDVYNDFQLLTDPASAKFGFVRGKRKDFDDPNNIARIFAMIQEVEYSGGVLEGDGLWITEPTVQQVVKSGDSWKELNHVVTMCCDHFWEYSGASWYSSKHTNSSTNLAAGIEVFILLD